MSHSGLVAIIGMSGCFPGSSNLRAFWQSISAGRTHFREVPADRWNHAGFYSANPRHTDATYAKRIAHLDDIRSFAPEWYGILPRRARPMDPQQRLMLDQTRIALDDAGYGARRLPASTGVYVGASVAEYKELVVSRLRARQLLAGEWARGPFTAQDATGAVNRVGPIHAYSMSGQLLNMIACNISAAFDFGGPALVTDAACSSALLAVHEAVLHLRAGICDAAVVGGVYTICTPDMLVGFSRIGALSRADECRPFDEAADGFVLGEGAGCVVLKRLEDARRDADRIWAVIRGVGLNNDGRADGPMTPRRGGQAEALVRAYTDAHVSPDTVGLIEAHGTATPVGDITEIAALRDTAKLLGQGPIHCAVGSVKGNIGHTLAAAGMAGLIKAVMSVNRKVIPPQAGLRTPRASLELDGSGFYLPMQAEPFQRVRDLPRRAGVSSFGFGGTNVHIVIEEAPAIERRLTVNVPVTTRPELFVISAVNPALLRTHLLSLADAVGEAEAPLADLAFTLTMTRRHEAARIAFIASSHADLVSQLHVAVASLGGEPAPGIFFHSNLPANDGQGPADPEGDATDQIRRAASKERLDVLNHLAALAVRDPGPDLSALFENCQPVSLPSAPLPTVPFWIVGGTSHGLPTVASVVEQVATPPAIPEATTSRDEVRQQVLALLSQVSAFPTDNLRPDFRLGVELGFDSLAGLDLYARLAERFPRVRDLPQSLVATNTTVEELIRAVGAAAQYNGDGAQPSAVISRYVVEPVRKPLPARPEGATLPFAGPLSLLADAHGVADDLARQLQQAGYEVNLIRSPDIDYGSDTGAVIDLTYLDRLDGDEMLAANWQTPVLTALGRACRVAARGRPPKAFVLVHAGPTTAGVAGVAKALRREWVGTFVKSIHIGSDAAPHQVADTVFGELMSSDPAVEVSYVSGQRHVFMPRPESIETSSIGPRPVVVIAGGGRGLGAILAIELARRHGARLLLLGRAAEAAATVEAVHAAGGDAVYLSCDVRQEADMTAAFAVCRERFGPIELVVHAAGILADGPIASHDRERSAAVIDTKVSGALALWHASRDEPIKTFAMYGSWAGRFGNSHQADYSAANHILAQLPHVFAAMRPTVRAVTLSLPAWQDSGMVRAMPETARRALAARVPLLSNEAGLTHVLAELGLRAPSGEVTFGVDLEKAATLQSSVVKVSASRWPWLNDHRLDGRIVVPLAAVLSEAAGAAHSMGVGPKLAFSNVMVAGPLHIPDEGEAHLQIHQQGTSNEATIEIAASGEGRTSAVRLRAVPVTEPLPMLQMPLDADAPRLSLPEFYQRHTFHGPQLRALSRIVSIGATHAAAVLGGSGTSSLSSGPVDILAFDGMLQLCAYWSAQTMGRVGLPTGAAEVRILGQTRPGDNLRAAGVVRTVSEESITSDVDLLDGDDHPVFQIRGLHCRLSPVNRRLPAIEGHEPAESQDLRASWSISEFVEVKALQDRLQAARAAGIENPYFTVHEGVANETSVIRGHQYLNFASYNYVGLSGDADVTGAAIDALLRYGTSVSASRLASGERPLHLELEREIADFLECEDAIVMVGGHATNVSVIGYLFGPQDLVVHDSLAHDSIVGGIRLSGAKRQAFAHNDVEALDRLLTEVGVTARRVLIAVEGVYSMDGDIAPLDHLIEVKRRHRALLLVDEAHSLGVLGRTGRGIGESFGVRRQDVDIWMGTLSKSLASCGGYIAGSRLLIQYLKYTNPGFVYSVGISPANAAAAAAALRKLRAEPERVATLQDRSRLFLDLSRRLGLDTGHSDGTAIVPCIVGDSVDCLRLSRALAARHINVQPILYPAVEESRARLRFFLSSRHTPDQIRATVHACAEELARLGPRYQVRVPRHATSAS